jgi:hypothetical protein
MDPSDPDSIASLTRTSQEMVIRNRLTSPDSRAITCGPPATRRWPVLFPPIPIRSISSYALSALGGPIPSIRELAWFERTIDLLVGESVIALVLPDIGNGPFHAVVPQLPAREPGNAWRSDAADLHCGPWRISITHETAVWDPSPNWATLGITDSGLCLLHSVSETALRGTKARRDAHFIKAIARAITNLLSAIKGEAPESVEAAARNLAGVGPGLTPLGDDVLAGVILSLWAARRPGFEDLGRHIAAAAAPRTTRLSRAFLEAASRGHVNADWHDLLDALSRPDQAGVGNAAQRILAVGATSGVAMLHGFVRGCEALRRPL